MIVARRATVLAAVLILGGCGSTPTPSPTPLQSAAPPSAPQVVAETPAPPAARAVTYLLPATSGTTFHVSNLPGDALGHAAGKGQYAYDFGAYGPFAIAAMRGGTVIGVRSDSTIQCKDANTRSDGTALTDCWTNANYVLVDHDDGTAALYMHLAADTVKVAVGATVCAGTELGTAGMTGWADAIHLHVQVEDTPAVPTPTKDKPTVTDPNVIHPGWWWTQSKADLVFAGPDAAGKTASDGALKYDTDYTSTNAPSCAAPPVPPATPKIGGTWVAPKAGAKLKTSSLTLSAKPTVTPSTLSVTKVAFSIKSGSTTKKGCSATKAGKGGVWSCKVDLWKLGAPLGKLTLSFDVTDSAGDVAKAPAGTRSVTFAAPPAAPTKVVTANPDVACSGSTDASCYLPLSLSWHGSAGVVSSYLVYATEMVPGANYDCTDATLVPAGPPRLLATLKPTATNWKSKFSYGTWAFDAWMIVLSVQARNAAGSSARVPATPELVINANCNTAP